MKAATLSNVSRRMRRLTAAALAAALFVGPLGLRAQPAAPNPPAVPPAGERPTEDEARAPGPPTSGEERSRPTAEPNPEGGEDAAEPGASEPAPPDGGQTAPTPPPRRPDQRPPPSWSPSVSEGVGPAPPEPFGAVAPVRYTLENIVVVGNTHTGSRVVLRYIPFQAGDVIDVDDPELVLTRYRLLGTGFFRDVQFSLRKGTSPGYVVLVVEVVERNTVIVEDLRMGLSADADTEGDARPLTAYAGLGVAETNLAGTGISLGASAGLAQNQLALRVRFLDPAFLGSHWMTSASLLYANAQDYFGNLVRPNQVVYGDSTAVEEPPDFAVLDYKRFGGSLGVGRDLSTATQFWLSYRLESIDADVPLAAAHERGGEIEPIDFYIEPEQSVLSTLRGSLQYDSRDQPFLPTSGWLASSAGELALAPAGSDYAYQRFEVYASRWWTLPWKHVARLELFGGAITGNAPFFEMYYVGDFSDFLAGRILQLNFDRRPAPNFLGTAISEVKRGEYAAKLGGEYRIPLYRGKRSVFGIDLFTSAGIFGVAGQRDIDHPPATYRGAARVPVDLTANFGFRMDTSAGGFTFAFSNVLGFIPVRGVRD